MLKGHTVIIEANVRDEKEVCVISGLPDAPIRIDKKTCFVAALSLSGNLVLFHGLISTIQQAILLGFERIVLPPIDVGFIEKTKLVEPLITPNETTEEDKNDAVADFSEPWQ